MWASCGSLFLFGGAALAADGSETTFGDLWRYDLEGSRWQPVPLLGEHPLKMIRPLETAAGGSRCRC